MRTCRICGRPLTGRQLKICGDIECRKAVIAEYNGTRRDKTAEKRAIRESLPEASMSEYERAAQKHATSIINDDAARRWLGIRTRDWDNYKKNHPDIVAHAINRVPPIPRSASVRLRNCRGCDHFDQALEGCIYILNTGHMRPCPPGDLCTVKETTGKKPSVRHG